MTRLKEWAGFLARSRAATLLYYLAVIVGLVLLYLRGEVSTSGFIYQAF